MKGEQGLGIKYPTTQSPFQNALQDSEPPRSAMNKSRTIWKYMTAFGLVAAPMAIVALQAGASNSASTTQLQQSGNSVMHAATSKSPADSNSAMGHEHSIQVDTTTSTDGASSHQQQVNIESNSSNSSTGVDSSSVTVNGKHIELPENGHVQRTITHSDGQTTVDITVNSPPNSKGASSNGTSSSSFTVNINSEASSRQGHGAD